MGVVLHRRLHAKAVNDAAMHVVAGQCVFEQGHVLLFGILGDAHDEPGKSKNHLRNSAFVRTFGSCFNIFRSRYLSKSISFKVNIFLEVSISLKRVTKIAGE